MDACACAAEAPPGKSVTSNTWTKGVGNLLATNFIVLSPGEVRARPGPIRLLFPPARLYSEVASSSGSQTACIAVRRRSDIGRRHNPPISLVFLDPGGPRCFGRHRGYG